MKEWDDECCEEDDSDVCPTCHGTGKVHPLSAPKWFFCTGVTDCPDCDGLGRI